MKLFRLSVGVTLLAAMGLGADLEVFSAGQLKSLGEEKIPHGKAYADHSLARYGNHYLLLVRRDGTGSSEVHEHEADVFVIETGKATMLSGGKLVGAHQTKPGEMRGTSIAGGDRRSVGPGDVLHIPAGVAHQLLIEKGQPFTYFVVKVAGQ